MAIHTCTSCDVWCVMCVILVFLLVSISSSVYHMHACAVRMMLPYELECTYWCVYTRVLVWSDMFVNNKVWISLFGTQALTYSERFFICLHKKLRYSNVFDTLTGVLRVRVQCKCVLLSDWVRANLVIKEDITCSLHVRTVIGRDTWASVRNSAFAENWADSWISSRRLRSQDSHSETLEKFRKQLRSPLQTLGKFRQQVHTPFFMEINRSSSSWVGPAGQVKSPLSLRAEKNYPLKLKNG